MLTTRATDEVHTEPREVVLDELVTGPPIAPVPGGEQLTVALVVLTTIFGLRFTCGRSHSDFLPRLRVGNN